LGIAISIRTSSDIITCKNKMGTSNSWVAIIIGTNVIVVTVNFFMFARRISGSLRITRISGTHIVIVTVNYFGNASLVLATVNSSTRVNFFTSVRFIITSTIIIAEIYSARIRIITVNGVMSASSRRITSILSTRIIIIAASSIG
jgi:hypothetical protein